ncbi:N-acetyltransferase [Geothermobacter hydrogeniphilus]|uniref:GNAT family N-acetyltransferase n=1 Tax=Geothermobacter hydrogeniphilus TaxID=1969733 RepID=A0A1X0Y5V5_9BACT|nr:N-acetyltransferase [Geothermobacter hydrogeniphilus]ORJ60516.1 GNAT family N-acetyltransferase [Geothermobacter hydrogeniphilus]
MVRKAVIADAPVIHQLLNTYAGDGLMLSASLAEIYEYIRSFYVYVQQDRVVGTVRLQICWKDLAEIRSLAVAAEVAGQGIGRQLVEACLQEARDLGLPQVFALTYKVGFFTRLGFNEIDKARLPQKIWRDCIKCAKFPECDETAVSLLLSPGKPPVS